MNKLFLLVTPLVLLLVVSATHNAIAWDFGPWFSDGFDPLHHWGSNDNGSGVYGNGYYAGQQDAIYDHNQGLVYNPYPQCCHSELYRHTFQEGYDQQWNTYQQTDQHTNIYVNGNNNYINTAQSSDQGQGQSQEQGPSWTSPDNTNGDCSNGCPWRQGP